jgi:hypothetical protein
MGDRPVAKPVLIKQGRNKCEHIYVPTTGTKHATPVYEALIRRRHRKRKTYIPESYVTSQFAPLPTWCTGSHTNCVFKEAFYLPGYSSM